MINRKMNYKDVIAVKEGQTAIIFSDLCQEAFCFEVRGFEEFYGICKASSVAQAKKLCLDAGCPSDFVVEHLDDEGCAYVINAYSQNDVAIAVEEIKIKNKFELRLSNVRVNNFSPLSKSYKEEKEQGF